MSEDASKSAIPGLRFVRDLLRAMTDEATYDLRRNPSLTIGFVLAIPIPLLAFAAGAPAWIKLFTLPAPFVWAVILGAAGRMGEAMRQERDQMAGEVRRVVGVAREAQAHLGAETSRRRELEVQHKEVVSELKLAQAVQATLVPSPIQRDDVTVVARSIPTRYIGGDYVHANVVEGRWLYLCLLDVAGHGISASLVVARLHGVVRRLTLTKQAPAEMLLRLNRAAQELMQHTYFFMTGFLARVDLSTGEMEYATAGHPAQILLHADGTTELLRTANRLMGMHEEILDESEPTRFATLRAGDSIVLFTDGLFELLEDGRGAVLGEAGLHERIRGLGALSPPFLIGEVLQELADFQGSSEFEDDVTMLVARYRGRPAAANGSGARS